jgi:hypothetical protein
MPDIESQYREIGRRSHEFDYKSNELQRELEMIEKKLNQHDLADNPPTKEEIASLVEMSNKAQDLSAAQTKLANKIKSIKAGIDAQKVSYEQQIRERVREEVDQSLSPDKQAMQAMKIRLDVVRQAAKSKDDAQLQVTRLYNLSKTLSEHLSELKLRIASISNRQAAVKVRNESRLTKQDLEHRKASLSDKLQTLLTEKTAHETDAGPEGAEARREFLASLQPKVDSIVAAKGFIDPISPVTQAINSVPKNTFHHTELTFINSIMHVNRSNLLTAIDPYIAVSSKIKEGDASHAYTAECAKLIEAIKSVFKTDDTRTKAIRWWKNETNAASHLDRINAHLESSLQYKILRFIKSDISEWTKALK